MMKLDTRFLKVHPATAAWWDQREKCARCAHVLNQLENFPRAMPVMRCKITPVSVGRQPHAYCIDARSEGSACGPWASLWEGKE